MPEEWMIAGKFWNYKEILLKIKLGGGMKKKQREVNENIEQKQIKC